MFSFIWALKMGSLLYFILFEKKVVKLIFLENMGTSVHHSKISGVDHSNEEVVFKIEAMTFT